MSAASAKEYLLKAQSLRFATNFSVITIATDALGLVSHAWTHRTNVTIRFLSGCSL